VSALKAKERLAFEPMGRAFHQSLMTNLLNPKMARFVLALFPRFVRPSSGPCLHRCLC
jgi:threonine/homoserine/homoserine lactone efflux protein